ncbi:hypothetical protein [Prochlorococcus sp. ALOHA_ZT_50]|uniref:hypothetical protein n=1 Tax=Prochlorococcus sp. ALOHA_ZT_50 TaxID=2919303 RepID=UPI002580AC54|nr:hypothetical protein [Prochlorococcus sp. ALOHA_ZT_50]MCH2079604.1 hypothetical protein [Prochlorococcus sp. ALOHA_ZT_50]
MKRPRKQKNAMSISHEMSPKLEAKLKDDINKALMVKGSGRGRDKLDVKVPGLARVEHKVTKNKSYSVTLETLKKMRNGCEVSEVPFLNVQFINEEGRVIEDCILTSKQVLLEYIEMGTRLRNDEHQEVVIKKKNEVQ